jgi:hypothetical protein
MLQIYDSTIGDYVSRKITAADLGACICSLIGYTLVLDTEAKTVLAAINEVNSKSNGNASDISSLSGDLTLLAFITKYQNAETASLSGVVLPVYDDGAEYHFTIPLSKPVLGGLEAALSGDFTIPGVLTSDTLASLGTVTVDITPIGLNVTITPDTYAALTTPFIVGESDASITFTEEES